ncbi:MAG TPA: hypothetical protein VNG69_08275 [Casimicrobiaceae bacterium]|nr:hypothetical protein [Casimicrobiaceae bacterium]
MTASDRVKDDLSYIAGIVRREDRDNGLPVINFMWSVLVGVGFALPDFAPRWVGWYWLIVGPIGGLASWWLGARQGQKAGVNDIELGRRYAYHWLLAAFAFVVVFLPALTGKVSPAAAATNVLLVGGLTHALAGVHLERHLLWSGLLLLGGYVALSVLQLPYVWTATGLIVAASLALAGVTQLKRT